MARDGESVPGPGIGRSLLAGVASFAITALLIAVSGTQGSGPFA